MYVYGFTCHDASNQAHTYYTHTHDLTNQCTISCTRTYVCTSIYVYQKVHTRTRTHAHAHTHTYTHTQIACHGVVQGYIHTDPYTYNHTHTYTHTHALTLTHTPHAHTHTHAHTHIRTLRLHAKGSFEGTIDETNLTNTDQPSLIHTHKLTHTDCVPRGSSRLHTLQHASTRTHARAHTRTHTHAHIHTDCMSWVSSRLPWTSPT